METIVTKEMYETAKVRVDYILNLGSTPINDAIAYARELEILGDLILLYEEQYCPIQEPELYTKQDLEDVFYAGFSQSGEGWNAEYLGDEGTIDGNMDIITKRLKDNFDSYIKDVKPITM